jgi:hypothetical protein
VIGLYELLGNPTTQLSLSLDIFCADPKSGRHDIAEILLKVALNTKHKSINQIINHLKQNTIIW